MATKAEIQTQINTIDDGGNNTAAEVRDVLGTNSSSLLENIYPDIISDTDASSTIIVANSNFSYDVDIVKIGRLVNIKGTATNISGSTQNQGASVFSITNTTYLAESSVNNLGTGGSNEPIRLTVAGSPTTTFLQIGDAVFNNENLRFNLFYQTLN